MKKTNDPSLELKKSTADYTRDAELITQQLLAEKTKEELAAMLAVEMITKQIDADLREIYDPQITAIKAETASLELDRRAEAKKESQHYLDKLIIARDQLTKIHSKNHERARKAALVAANNRAKIVGKEDVFIEYFTLSDTGFFKQRGAKKQFDQKMSERHCLDEKTVEKWRLEIQRFVKGLPIE
jgi:predicted Mrr-cat superfamily restriction endonuclease